MNQTSVPGLLAAGGFCAAFMAVFTWGFYGSMSGIPIAVSVTLWGMTVVCVILARKVRGRVERGEVGQDRSQLSPMTVAQFVVIAKASAWTGAIVGGAYLGIGVYVIPRVGQLTAASDDLPGVLASALGGICLSLAGLYLEKQCETPPPTDGEAVG
ncbi:DUF3180 domain-containing protein [Corynebacterium alimapuense]|uniref:DUF3180 domain-containing protein n=1 Tax=Corynebacterium alimapuense TaxID=1576874 RepID=A0A3M8KBI7_9CORY|nr:DUF3180 domain-containing protein [Corynebacterium alimapuense]RNE49882.1 DUF3180 domain-containing protein [Corynebacterium alimapuense]